MLKIIFFLFSIILMANAFSQNHQNIEINNKDIDAGFTLLDDHLKGKKYFFTGENHNFSKSNYLLQFKFARYLHKKVGLNKIVLEFGQGTGWLINQYLQSGDSLYFNELKKFFSTENLSLYRDLHALNEKNPENKISCHGIDLERYPQISVSALNFLLPKKITNNDSLNVSIETLRAIYSLSDYYPSKDFYKEETYNLSDVEIFSSFNLWLINYSRLKEEYKVHLGDVFEEFNKIVEGLSAGKKWNDLKESKTLQSSIFREQFMYKSLQLIEEKYPDSKFYGQFGRCHIRTDKKGEHCYSYTMKSLIYRINESEYADELMIVPIFYVRNIFIRDKKYIENNIENFWGTREEVYLLKVPNDMELPNAFSSRTEYVIINNLKLSRDQLTTDPFRTEKEKKKIPTLRFSAEVEMGISYLEFDEMNNFLFSKGLAGFRSQNVTIGGIFSVFSPYGFYYGVEFAIGLPQRVDSDSVSLTLSNYNVMMNVGVSLLNTTWFSFNPMIGIGGGNFNLKETRTVPNTSSMNLFSENNQNYTVYKNPSFLVDVKGEIKFNINIFSISFKGGYLFDVTNKRWKNPDILTGSPKQSMSGWHLRGGLGINIKVY